MFQAAMQCVVVNGEPTKFWLHHHRCLSFKLGVPSRGIWMAWQYLDKWHSRGDIDSWCDWIHLSLKLYTKHAFAYIKGRFLHLAAIGKWEVFDIFDISGLFHLKNWCRLRSYAMGKLGTAKKTFTWLVMHSRRWTSDVLHRQKTCSPAMCCAINSQKILIIFWCNVLL